MAKTQAERAREYRNRKRDVEVTPGVTKCDVKCDATVTVCDELEKGPLDVYSESRWAFLRSRGHVWDAGLGRSTRPAGGGMIIGVTVPGDPGYDVESHSHEFR